MPEKLTEWIREANRILIFTGAGISTPSGIPAFRGAGGIWTTRQPVLYQDFMTKESARTEYWQYKLELWQEHGNAQPNIIHDSIVDLEKAGKVEMIVTQNVDGLHLAAGTSRNLLVEVHGNGTLVECQSCGFEESAEPIFEKFKNERACPICKCGGYLKPATISFGQNLKGEDLRRAQKAANRCDLVIALGSTLSVSPANTIPLIAAQAGTPYIIINRDETDHDDLTQVTLRLTGNVENLFPPAVKKALQF